MSILSRLFNARTSRQPYIPLYTAVVAEARRPFWYAEGGAPDTLDGRFDMVAAVMALVLIRMEADGEAGREPAARLTELFVDDMDGQLRQQGVGDVVVGKHVGRMMAALGGRIAAYRDGLAGGDLEGALVRNLWRGQPPAIGAGIIAAGMRALADRLAGLSLGQLLEGRLS
ncbi:ubiquinol-cytochrome C chaperone family protein [Sphingomonas quercus]|uniref:ubiquinol-cytochrome C chaperone family protein n=1 Tax=Sphingomonas quercus TaxID=2842451 RepID=UPI00209AE388|nr:ubiquinol-cytochrome C chaperone family protein [Sphingomonas quercus]